LRVEFKFNADDKIVLPIHHNHIIQGFIYNSFSDESFASFLHDFGYKWNKRNFKLFAFSRLMGRFTIDRENKNIVFEPPVKLVITSIKDRIIQDLTANVIKKNWLQLGKQRVFVEELEFKTFKKNTNTLTINMLSPVVTYHTEKINGSKKTRYYTPWEEEFKQQIKNNLIKKYEIIKGKDSGDAAKDFDIKPLFKKGKPSIVIYRGFVIKGWMGKFRLAGDPELLQIGYNCGIGAKNSMGHGCFEILIS